MARIQNKAESTVDTAEVAQFSAIADEWWDENGKFRPLHRLNPVRVGYIRDMLCRHYDRDPQKNRPLEGLKIIDIGCGGGLTAEFLCRLGAEVTAIDAAQENIDVARAHAAQEGLEIDYRVSTAEELANGKTRYDAVISLEVVEHVADVALYFESCCALVKNDGLAVFSTLNRTRKAWLLGIVAAEYILRWLPRGTHDWRKFVKPSEMAKHLRHNGMDVADATGLVYNPVSREFSLNPRDIDVNYLLTATR